MGDLVPIEEWASEYLLVAWLRHFSVAAVVKASLNRAIL